MRVIVSILLAAVVVACLCSKAYAVSALNVGHLYLSTDAGLRVGTTCYSNGFRVDQVDTSENGGTISCGSWTIGTVQPVLSVGLSLPIVAVVGQGTYTGCRLLSMAFAGTAGASGLIEIECRGAGPAAVDVVMASGFEP